LVEQGLKSEAHALQHRTPKPLKDVLFGVLAPKQTVQKVEVITAPVRNTEESKERNDC